MSTAPGRSVEEFLAFARDLAAAVAAFYVSPEGAVESVVSPSVGDPNLDSQIFDLARRCHFRAGAGGRGAVVEPGIASLRGSVGAVLPAPGDLAAYAVQVSYEGRPMGLLGIADYFLALADVDLEARLDRVARDLARWLAGNAGLSRRAPLARSPEPAAPGADSARTSGEREHSGLEGLERREAAGGPGELRPDSRTREGFLAELADHLPDGLIVTRADGTIVYANRPMGEQSHRSVEELLGRDIATVLHEDPSAGRGAFSPTPHSIAFLLDTSPDGRILELQSPTGDARQVEVRGTFLFSAFAGECYAALVRSRPEAPTSAGEGPVAPAHEAGLDGRRAAFEGVVVDRPTTPTSAGPGRPATGDVLASLTEALEDGLVVCDGAGTVLVANRAASELCGVEPQRELVGHRFPETTGLRKSDGTTLSRDQHPLFRALGGTNVAPEMLVLVDAEGARRQISASARPLRLGDADGAMLVLRDATSQLRDEARRVQMALRDPLTGLASRHLLFDYLSRYSSQLRTRGGMIAFVYLDLVGFKQVNDRYGRETGDEILSVVARRIEGTARSSDVVARTGSDEFVALPHMSAAHEIGVEILANRVRGVLGAPYHVRGLSLNVEASVGTVVADPRDEDPTSLLVRAEREMYRNRSTSSPAGDPPWDAAAGER